jgi:hypothetical protein
MYLLGLGEVKQTINTPIIIDRLTNKANIKIPIVVGSMRKQKQNLFLLKIKCTVQRRYKRKSIP